MDGKIELANGWALEVWIEDVTEEAQYTLTAPADHEGHIAEYYPERIMSIVGGGVRAIIDGKEKYIPLVCPHADLKIFHGKKVCKVCGKYLGKA